MKSSTIGAIVGYLIMCLLNGKLIPALSIDAFIGVAIGMVLGLLIIPVLHSFHPSNISILLNSIGGGKATKGATLGSILGGIFGILPIGYFDAIGKVNADLFVVFVAIFIGGGAFLGMLLGAAIQIDRINRSKR